MEQKELKMLDQLFGGKPWFKSMTGWALFIYIMAQAALPGAVEAGIASPEAIAPVLPWMDKVALMLGVLGIRRRLPK